MTKEIQTTFLNVKKETIALWLLLLFTFSLPLSVAVNNVFAVLIFLFWLFRKTYRQTWMLVQNSKVLMGFLLFFILHIVGLLWTTDLQWGLHILKKEWLFLFAPILMSLVQRKYLYYYLSAFLLAMTLSEGLSYLIWFHVVPPLLHATTYDPTPFMHHTSYNPLLAVAIYILGYFVLFDKTILKQKKIIFILFFTTMSINMFITGGRAGQVGYLVIITVLLLQYFYKNLIRGVFLAFLLVGSIFSLAYFNSTIFHDRVNLALEETQQCQAQTNTSVGLRITFAQNTWKMIQKSPFFGVGTGDFKDEYEHINRMNTPQAISTCQPHNMYLLVLAQFGLVGLLIFLYIFYEQIHCAMQKEKGVEKGIGIMLPIVFMVIMLSDSYLLGHFTTVLFILFSALVYKPVNETNA